MPGGGLLDGKVALISGAGGGQGRAAALIFAREGAKIVGCDVNVQGSEETLRLVAEAGGDMISVHPCDASDPDAAAGWVESAAARFGGVDILYNNAGAVRSRGAFGETTLEGWNETLRFELTIVYVCTKAAWPLLTRRGGIILNVGSIVAHRETFPSRSTAHSAAKAGVLGLTRSLAAEGAPYGVRALSISPGLIRSPTTEHYWGSDRREIAKRNAFLAKIPLGRAGLCEEVAEVAAFLASGRASYVNGADLMIDGGLNATSYGDYDALPESGNGRVV